MESRRPHRFKQSQVAGKSSDLPVDYMKMVTEIFNTTFSAGLKGLKKLGKKPRFDCQGRVFTDEIVLAISLVFEGEIAATTAYASCDFDPKASAPTIQDILGACVDALGSVYENLFSPKNLEAVVAESLSALEEIPLEWQAFAVGNLTIHLKVDKANPKLDEMADEWLAKNDPEYLERLLEEQEETEKLFVTGPASTKRSGGQTSH